MTKNPAIIIGGTGQIGQAVAQCLLDREWTVPVTHRGNSTLPQSLIDQCAQIIIYDRDQETSLARVIGQGADVVIDAIAFDATTRRSAPDKSG
jgi:nucleoside-diphosphate-sugar epimerase